MAPTLSPQQPQQNSSGFNIFNPSSWRPASPQQSPTDQPAHDQQQSVAVATPAQQVPTPTEQSRTIASTPGASPAQPAQDTPPATTTPTQAPTPTEQPKTMANEEQKPTMKPSKQPARHVANHQVDEEPVIRKGGNSPGKKGI